MGKFKLEKGMQIGRMEKEFYTRNGKKKLRYRGYILFGIFGDQGAGLEITVYKIPPDNLPSWTDEEMFRIRSGRRTVGYFVKQTGVSQSGKSYTYLKGKLEIGGLKIKIRAYPEGAEKYRLELSEALECGILRLG